MSTSARSGYHHGDLRAALLAAAMDLLEGGGDTLSLRAVARRAGVSSAAPYRHYADKETLESALATVGFADLKKRLASAGALPTTPEDFASMGVTYVRFAMERPALFRLMFGNPCVNSNDERAAAAAEVLEFVRICVSHAYAVADAEALATASWSLVHGLAFLHLDGKFAANSPEEVDTRVRSAIIAIVTLQPSISS
jgi:AcrR family transcriptional regulator